MDFIKQPYKSLKCGQTCLAMITGFSIESVCKKLSNYWTTNIYDDLQPFLNNNGYTSKVVKALNIEFSQIPNNSILFYKYPSGNGHFVTKHNDQIYDPNYGIVNAIDVNARITTYLEYSKINL